MNYSLPASAGSLNGCPPTKCVCCKSTPLPTTILHHIFGQDENASKIQLMLVNVLKKPVVEKSNVVQAICDDCLGQLEQSFAFKMRYEESEGNDSSGEPAEHFLDDQCPESNIVELTSNVNASSFVECLDIQSIKSNIRTGIPVHQGTRTSIISNEALSTKSFVLRRGKVKKEPPHELQLNPFQISQVNIDEYLQSLFSVSFDQMDATDATRCSVSLNQNLLH